MVGKYNAGLEPPPVENHWSKAFAKALSVCVSAVEPVPSHPYENVRGENPRSCPSRFLPVEVGELCQRQESRVHGSGLMFRLRLSVVDGVELVRLVFILSRQPRLKGLFLRGLPSQPASRLAS